MLLLAFIACNQATSSGTKQEALAANTPNATEDRSKPLEHPEDLFTLEDAEKVLGEKAHMSESSSSKRDTFLYRNAYMGNSKDAKTNKTGVVYFLVEQYPEEKSAHESYIFFKKANEKNGIKVLNDLGDEAYFHSDNKNFYFVLVRKGDKMFRMKVNKITGNISLDDFDSVSRKITAAL